MNEPQPLVQFPIPSTGTLYLLFALLLAAIVAAVVSEIRRRRRTEGARLDSDWTSLRAILAERSLSDTDIALLEKLIRKFARKTPLRAITTREGFDTLAEGAMNALNRTQHDRYEQLGIQLRSIRKDLGLDYVPVGQALRSTRELHDGLWVSLAPPVAEPADWVRVMIEDVNEAYVYVASRDNTTRPTVALGEGREIRVRLWREEDARYIFTATVAAYEPSPPAWRLYHSTTFERSQTRADYRIRHDQSTTIAILNASRNRETTELRSRPAITRLQGRITSLSAGGCAIVFQQPVARQVLLRFAIEIPGNPPMETEAEIVGVTTISGGRHLIRCKYLGLSEQARDTIARYILIKQQQRIAASQRRPG